jgi:hypothetical protein
MDYWNAMLQRNESDMYSLVVGSKYTKAQKILEAIKESEKVGETAIDKTVVEAAAALPHVSKGVVAPSASATEDKLETTPFEDCKTSAAAIIKKEGEDNVAAHAVAVAAIDKTAPAVEEVATMNKTAASQESVRDDDHVAHREASMAKRNARQEQLAHKAMKQYQDGVKKLGVSSGAIVTLKVDFRVHYHATGLIGVVYKTKDTGGVLVVCEHGVITSSGSTKDFWVPNDQYKVVAVANANAPISTELQEVREKVMNGTYDYSGQPRISYAKYHDIIIGASSPTKRSRCSCKKGCKKSTCGCLKKGLTCHSACGCNGNCENEK